MFEKLGHFVSQRWQVIIVAWLALVAGLFFAAPTWDDVVQDGEFAFLPEDSASRQAEAAFAKAFPDDILASSVFVVVRRTSNQEGLNDNDRAFVHEVLVPALKKAIGFVDPPDDEDDSEPRTAAPAADDERVVLGVNWFDTKFIGPQLDSRDNKATLVHLEMRYEFLDKRNHETVQAVEEVLARMSRETKLVTLPAQDGGEPTTRETPVVPAGLDLAISGNATFGRDMVQAADQSGKATERWTVILVVGLLLLIYRAPLLALIPLITVAIATEISKMSLAIMAMWGWVDLFAGIETYVTVVVYGAGVDYCLFLIARYREELDGAATMNEAVVSSLSKVGAALTASAGTVMCGIGMMVFAEFGKFQQAGVAITFGLATVLCAALTFTPAVLRAAGRWAFWPNVPTEKIEADGGWISPTSLVSSLRDRNPLQAVWKNVSSLVLSRPATVFLTSIAAMAPFAVVGVIFFGHLSYGLLSELPPTAPSVNGVRAAKDHFPAGEVAPVRVILRKEGIDFSDTNREVREPIKELTRRIADQRDELGVAKVRSLTEPAGLPNSGPTGLLVRRTQFRYGLKHFVSKSDTSTTRLDVILKDDPFGVNSLSEFKEFKTRFRELLPSELEGAELSFVGDTASLSDLKAVTDRDQIRIDLLVLSGVFLILVVLLRRPMISLYLIVSVFFSYLATLGMTFAVFWALDPSGFAGLDWKVPMFLFTILIAVGEDYNIFLMTRIDEEGEKHGPLKGITVALEKTGSIISSCGIIMAGTFSSLMAGSLVGMDQLGFALAFGVLLDTFVVRPILVPSYLVLLHSGRFGRLGKFLGAKPTDPIPASTS